MGDIERPKRNQIITFIRRPWAEIPSFDRTARFSYRSLLGLPLVWVSAYFVPRLKDASLYLLPSDGLLKIVVLPSIIGLATGALLLWVISAVRGVVQPQIRIGAGILGLAALGVIAVKVSIAAFRPNWQYLIPSGANYLLNLRIAKYGLCAGVLSLVWMTRRHLNIWDRALSSFGIALGVLAVVRVVTMWIASSSLATSFASSPGSFQGDHSTLAQTNLTSSNADTRTRRVVWIIFDEADFARMYAASNFGQVGLKNFSRLSNIAVFATNANSPASATLYSIPALLSGVPIAGHGIQINRSAALSLERTDGTLLPFGEATSIFGALHSTGRSASVLGFYHPYCRLFQLQRCDSFSWPLGTGLYAAFWANVPDFLSGRVEESSDFGDVTQNLVRLLPEYLRRDDSLTFVHLNLPHLPAVYADQVLHVSPSADPLVEYSRNLSVADLLLGDVMKTLEVQAMRREVVLVVSTDHWLRKSWYHGLGKEESRAVPFIVWKVGTTSGVTVSNKVSTVNTAALILDYLDGKLNNQSDFAQWLEAQPTYPSFIAPIG